MNCLVNPYRLEHEEILTIMREFLKIMLTQIKKAFPKDIEKLDDVFKERLESCMTIEYGEIINRFEDTEDLTLLSQIILRGFTDISFDFIHDYVMSYKDLKTLLELSENAFGWAKIKFTNDLPLSIEYAEDMLKQLNQISMGFNHELKISNAIKELTSEILIDIRYASERDSRQSLRLLEHIKNDLN